MMEALAPSTSSNGIASSMLTDEDVSMVDAASFSVSSSQQLPDSQQQVAGQTTSRLDVLAAASAIHSPPGQASGPAQVANNSDGEGDATSESGSVSDSVQSDDESLHAAPAYIEPYAWRAIAQDTSLPSLEELKYMAQHREVSAMDSVYWRSVAFTDLEDPEYAPLETVEFDWPIAKFNGTAESPNRSLVMYSPSFHLAGARWRLKLYPKGNETGYISAYLECVSLQKDSAVPNMDFEDGGDAEYSAELLKPILPTLHIPSESKPDLKPLRRQRSLPVQFGIFMYNPQVPTVHHHCTGTHLFTHFFPDAGFSRFGSIRVQELGRRALNKSAPLLQGDRLNFRVHARVLSDPSGLLYHDGTKIPASREQFARTGLREFSDKPGSIILHGPSSMFSAVMVLSLLPAARRLLYAAEAHFRKTDMSSTPRQVQRPLLSTLTNFLEDVRDSSSRNTPVDCNVPEALRRHAYAVDEELDVVMMLDRFGQILEKEIKGAGLSFRSLLLPAALRYKLPLDRTSSVRSGVKALLETESVPTNQFPRLLQVELPRWHFDHHEHQWKPNTKRITTNDPMRLTADSSGVYRLYACVMHHGNFQSGQYTCIIRPDLKSWYRFSNLRTLVAPVVRLTSKQAMELASEHTYLALYVRDDVAKSTMSEVSKTFQGWPESRWLSEKKWLGYAEPMRPPLKDRFERVRQILQMHKTNHNLDKQSNEPRWATTQLRVKYFNPFEQRFETPRDELITISIDTTAKSSGNVRLEDLARQFISQWPPGREMQIKPASCFGPLCDGDETKAELRACQSTNIDPSWALFLRVMTFLVQPELTGVEKRMIRTRGGLPDAVEFAKHAMHNDENFAGLQANGDGMQLQDCLGQEYHKGTASRGKWHGKGHHIYFSGDVYNGEFQMGVRHGRGFQTFQNGDTYDGEWIDDKMHGQGTFTQAATGNTYCGVFQKGQQHAPGTTTWRMAESRRHNCHICYEKEQNAAFMDCGHVCACMECARQVTNCPVCRRLVVRVLKIFYTT